ncbi:O-antigen ligase family protein [Rhizobium leguminosarum]|uniref:O-antigen ligase family protein n=1 Tax=Rhizobium leguminosarum TaxID=384 RepID=UPI003F95DBA3
MAVTDTLKSIFAGLYSALVLAAVVPFGLVDATPFAVVAICMFALGGAALLLFGEPRRGRWVFVWALLLFIATSVWIVIQTVHIPLPSLINPIWKDASVLIGVSRNTISVAPTDTLASLLYIALPAMTFLTGLIIADTDKRARRILVVLAIGAGLISLFGLGQFLLFPKMLLTENKRYYFDSLTAVFVNRNTAATFLGLGFLLTATFTSENGRAYLGFSSAPPGTFNEGLGFWAFGSLSVSCLTALMLTQSRAGLAVTGLGSVFLLPYLASQWKSRRRLSSQADDPMRRKWRLTAGAIVLVLLFIAIFGGRAILRADQRGTDDGRFCIWSDTVHALSQNWLQGTGFGTFRTVYSAYRTADCGIGGIVDRAHNSYLEGFLTLGMVFPIVAVLIFFVLIRTFWTGYRDRHRLRRYSILGCAGTVLTAAHATVDFSLQIPGFAIFFTAFLAAVVSICCGREERVIENRGRESPELKIGRSVELSEI